jgi:hypothetical protein
VTDEFAGGSANGLTRRTLEAVIARAVELSLDDADTQYELSEDELIRIAGELGLSPRHVRQALYERPIDEAPPTFLDRNFGACNVIVTRSVPCEQRVALSRLEDYLVTREYLQIRRRQNVNILFEPAEDAFSSIARAFSRPRGRFHLARTQRAYLSVRPLEPGWCHVRLEVAYPEQRKSAVIGALAVGGTLGIAAGSVAGYQVAVLLDALGPIGTVVGVAAGAATAGGAISLTWAIFKVQFRKWLKRGKDEADALLDRLELGEELRPPASPWLRRLQQRLRLGSPRTS